MIARLLVHVEGQMEESFVNEILRAHLIGGGYESVSARIVGNARLPRQRGGICSWALVRKDIIRHLRLTSAASPPPWLTFMPCHSMEIARGRGGPEQQRCPFTRNPLV